jgi:AraC-like DNA-binding protein/mannose-6-phosphate isomerase-like protein (cupin superfamily)
VIRHFFALIRFMSPTLITHRPRLDANCNRLRCEPGWHLTPQWAKRLSDYDFWLVWAGRGRLKTEDGDVELSAGQCVWLRPGRRYEADQNPRDPLGVNYFHFTFPGTRRFTPPFESMRTAYLDFTDTVMRRILVLHAEDTEAARVSAETLFGALLSELIREASAQAARPFASGIAQHHEEIVRRITAEIREHPAGLHTVAGLAASAGYSVDHFSRVFAKVNGCRPQDMLIENRLARARQLLAETGLTVGQIAGMLGFRDVFFFSRQFRAKTGRTPTGFRAELIRGQPDA